MERTRLSRFTSMLLAVIMILSMFTALSVTSTEVSAAENEVTVNEITTDIRWAKTVSFTEPFTGDTLTYYQGQPRHQLRINGTNKVAYCIQPGLFLHDLSSGNPVPLGKNSSNTWNSMNDDVRKSLKFPLYFGYPNANTTLTGTAAEKEVATQLIIWELICGYRDPYSFDLLDTRFAEGMFGTSYNKNTGVYDNYNRIISASKGFQQIASFSSDKPTKAPTYTMKWGNGRYTTTLTDNNGVLSNYAMSSDDTNIKFTQSGNKLTVTTTKALTNPVSVKAETKAAISSESNNTVVYGSQYASVQDVLQCDDVKPDPVPSYFRLTTEASGSLRVEKKYMTPDGADLGANVTSSMLLGTKFVVKNSSGKYVKATYPGSGITYTYSGFADTEAGGSAFYPKKSGSSFVFDITKLPPDTYTVMEKDPGQAGFYITGSSNVSVSVTANNSGGKKTAKFENRTSQLTVDKNFIQFDAVTDNDYRNIAMQVTQGSSTTPLKVKLIDAATNTYLYDPSSTLTKLTFRTPSVHNITIVGLPIKNSSGTAYSYTVSELPTGQVTGTVISNRYTYNSVTKTLSGTPVKDGTIDNTEKNIGEIEITKDFKIRNTNGTLTDFTGADGLTLQQAYDDISFLVKNSEGKYLRAVFAGSTYSFSSLADSKNEATEFKISSTAKKIRITGLPFSKYSVTEVIGGNVRGYGFNTQGSKTQTVTTKYDISSNKVVTGKAGFVNVKKQYVGLKIHKTFTDKDDAAVDISDKLYSQMEFTVAYNSNAQRFVLENSSKGTYHLYKAGSGETPVTVLKLGTSTHDITVTGLTAGRTYTVTEKITGTALKSLSYCDYSYAIENRQIKNYVQADENILVQSSTVTMPQGDNSSAEVYFNNTFKTTDITIYKESDDDLVERKFAVITDNYDLYPESSPLYVKTKPTTVDGKVRGEAAVSDLPYGYYDEASDTVVPIRYRIQEVHTPPYYEIPEAQVIVPKNGEKSVTFKNELKKGKIKVIKTAEVNGKTTTIPLPNVEFRLTNDYNNTVLTGKTNSKGELLFENLPAAVGYKEADGTESFHKIQYTVSEQASSANAAYVLSEDQTVTFSYTAEQTQRYKELTFVNKPILGSVELEKADKETKELLSGAVFRIYNDVNGNGKYDSGTDTPATGYLLENGVYKPYQKLVEVTEEVTDENNKSVTKGTGKYELYYLPKGRYIVYEAQAPEGYVNEKKQFVFEITKDGQHYTLLESTSGSPIALSNPVYGEYVYNKPVKADIRIEKTDKDTREKLSGAVFHVWKDTDGSGTINKLKDEYIGEPAEIMSNGKGTGIYQMKDLYYGSYLVVESRAPKGYSLNKTVYSVNVTEAKNGQTIKIGPVENEKIKGSVKTYKIDKDTKEKLRNVIFRVYNDVNGDGAITEGTDTLYGTLKFNSSDYSYYLNYLPYGDYVLAETKAPVNHVSESKVYPFSIIDNGKTIEIIDENEAFGIPNRPFEGTIKVVKTSKTGNTPVAGAEFSIYDEAGKLIKKVSTNSKGIADFGKLRYGKYTVKETAAPRYYELDSSVTEVNITDDGSIYTVDRVNTETEGNGLIKKTSEDGVLQGFKFQVKGTSFTGITVNKTFTTDAKGECSFTLPEGNYTVEEISVPARYKLQTGAKTIKIRKGQTASVSFENKLKKGNIIIYKYSSKYPDKLVTGAKFAATKGGVVVKEFTEISDGVYYAEGLSYGSYTIKETATPDGYIIDKGSYLVNIATDGATVTVTNTDDGKFAEAPIEGSIEILKIDKDTRKPIAGAKFTLYDAAGKAVKTLTTGTTGKVKFTNVDYGNYTVKETTAPAHYVLDSTPIPFEIFENGKTYTYTKENTSEKGTGKIKKTSEDGVVEGFKFNITGTSDTGKAVDETVTTNSKGECSIELPTGTYKVEELNPPARYNAPASQTITITKNRTATVTFNNVLKKGELRIEKINTKHPEIKVTGAEFTVYKDGAVYAVVPETETGIYVLKNIPYGVYSVKETKAPEGYIRSTKSYPFALARDGQQVSITNTEDGKFEETQIEGSIEILKIDKDTRKPIAGAKFTLYNAAGRAVKTLTTGTDGKVRFTQVTYGEYTVKETTAPAHYILDSTPIPFEILVNGKTYTYTKENTSEKGVGKIKKTSEDGVLEGFKFSITGTSNTGETVDETVTTNAKGECSIELPTGTYSVEEISVPVRYIKPAAKTITITKNKTSTVTFSNVLKKGTVIINKYSSKHPERKVTGAKFAVTKAGAVVKEFTEISEGVYAAYDIPYGSYTIRETSAPKGYIMDTGAYLVRIVNDGDVIHVTNTDDDRFEENEIEANVEILKIDGITKQPLAGAEFTLYDTNGSFVAKGTTGTDGKLKFTGLSYGRYVFKETQAPPNYKENSIETAFWAIVNGKTYTFTRSNYQESGYGRIKKTSGDGVLEGFTFHITGTSETGIAVDETLTTNANGECEVELPTGTYTVEEISVPARYIAPEAQTITITADQTATVNFSNDVKKGSLRIEKVNRKHPEIKVTGAEFTVYMDGEFYATVPEISEGIYELTNIPYGVYSVKETKAPEGYALNPRSFPFALARDGQQVVITNTDDGKFAESQIEGIIEIFKVNDVTRKPIEGAEFTLYNEGGTAVKTLTTDTNGKVRFTEVPYGKYTVKETTAPEHYIADDTPIPFEILEHGKTYSYTKENTSEKGTGKVRKTSDDGILEGFTFRITGTSYTGETVNKTVTTDADGECSIELPTGEYTVEELYVPSRYVKPEAQTITIVADQTATVSFSNIVKKGELRIEKINAKHPEIKVTGAEFTVYRDGEFYATVPEISEGIYVLTDIPYGIYSVRETEAPDGYIRNTKSYPFALARDGQQVIVSNTDDGKFAETQIEGSIELLKVNDVTGEPIEGAEFTLYDEKGNAVKTLTTDEEGKLTFSDVVYGKYTVKETTAPEHYILDDTPIPFGILEHGKTYYYSKDNTSEKGTGKIRKTSEDGVLEGFIFHITGTSNTGETVDETVTTDKNGECEVELPTGTYTVEEQSVPERYLVPEAQTITITKDNTSTVTFTNVLKKGSVRLEKVSSDDLSEKVTGAEFTVYRDDEEYGRLIETSDGVYELKDIPYGTYTVKETKAPEGFVPDTKQYSFTIINDGDDLTISNDISGKFTERPIYGSVKLVKLNSKTGEAIEGAEFTLSDADGEVITTLETDENGIVEFKNLRYGSYSVQETKAPVNYVIDDTVYDVDIVNDGEQIIVANAQDGNFYEVPIEGSLEIIKVDGLTKKPLAGAEFTLYDENETPIKTVVTDKNGKAVFTGILYGKYTVKETKAPDNYILDSSVYSFSIVENAQVVTHTKDNTPKSGSLKLIKKSEDGVVENIRFRIYGTAANGEAVDETVTTGKDGTITVKGLLIGTYTVEELATADRYISPQPQTVEIKENKTAVLNFSNILKKGSVTTTKVDAEYPDNKLTGAVFEIFDEDHNSVGILDEIGEGVYRLDGIIYGKYTLKETKAPEFCELDTNEYSFEITKDGEVKTIETLAGVGFIDNAQKGNLVITKRSSDGKKEGFSFRVTGTAFTGQKYDEVFTTDKDGKISIEGLRVGRYMVEETDIPDRYLVPDNQTVTISSGKTSFVEVENLLKKGSIEIVKIDELTRKPLSGAEFTLYDEYDNEIMTLTTGKDGKVTFSDVPYGSYTVVETKAPDKYEADSTPIPFSIVEDGVLIACEKENTPVPGHAHLMKTSEDGALSGFVFRIYGISDTGVSFDKTMTTDSNGEFVIDLLEGTYTVEEIETPDRYIQPAKQTVKATSDKTAEVSFSNILKKGSVTTTKVDADYPDNKLTGAVFEIFDENHNSIGTMKETDTGIYRFDELSFGRYILKETQAPEFYELDTNEYGFEITKDGEVKTIETLAGVGFIDNAQKGNLVITKRSSDGKKEGFSFRVTGTAYTGQKFDEVFTTDKDGKISIENLRVGEYTVSEISDETNVRYTLPQDKTVTVPANDAAKVEMFNDERVIPFEITKTDISTGKLIPDCSFRIRNSDGEIVVEGKTDKDGIAKFELVCGDYTYQEYDAPEGYIIDTHEYPFTINPDNTIVKAEMTNIGTGTLEMKKTDISTGEPIPDTSFRIRNSEGKVVREGKTNEEGIATFEELPYGKYTYQEYDAPEGYIIDSSEYPFEIKENGEVVKAEMTNTGTGTLEMKKTDISTGEPIPETSFRIRNSEGKVIREGKTNEEGIATFEALPYGKYTYQEYDAPEGYIIDSSEYHFEIKENGEIVKAEMKNTGTGTLEMKKTDISTGEPIPNTSFRIRNSEGKVVREGKTNEKGIATFEALPYGKYTYQEYDAPEGYIIDSSEYPFEIKKNSEIVKAEMKNTGTGTLEMTKTDISTGEPIPNTSFRIRNSEDKVVREGKTNKEGIAAFEALPYGKYTYQEYDAPEGYIIDSTEYSFEIKSNGEIVKAEMKNTGTGTLEITKTDISTGEPIPNTSFRIRNSEGKVVREGKTNEKGIATFEALPYGKYTYQEYDAPEGYIIDSSEYHFEIKENGEIVKAEMKNTGTGTLEMKKTDISTGEPIPNTSFRIRNSEGKVVREGKTDENGIASFTALPYGKYTYQEYDAPEGYIIDSSEYPFEIKSNGEIVKAEMKNTGTGTLEMKKTDISTGEPIPDTSFRIRNSEGKVIREGKTNEEGIATFEALPYGKYTYQEYDAPEGYIIDSSEYPFEIKSNGEIVKAEMKNTGTGTLEMKKTDISTGEPIPNTSFRIRNSKGEVIREGKTNEEGIATFEELPYGKYTYQEYDAPEGYIIDEAEYPFEIKENGEIVKAAMKNTGTGTLEITKTDISTGEPIPNTSFRIRNSEDKVVREGKTNKEGIATFEALPYGKYTYQEFDAPEGYIIDSSEYPFEIKENGEIVKAEMKNTGTGTVEITKKDVSTGELIPDCGIEILDENKKIIFQGRTDKNGIVSFAKLPYGKYFYREYDAPKGYLIDETAHAFEVRKNGEIVKAVMTNKRIEKTPGYITTDKPKVPREVTVPKTGDNTNTACMMFVLILSLSAVCFVSRKRKETETK